MKKIILLLFAVSLLFSCNQEEVLDNTSSELSFDLSVYDSSNMGTYKGVFTTMDSKTRGTILISLKANNIARASLTLVGGEIITLKAPNYISGSNITNLQFSNGGTPEARNQIALSFSVDTDGTNPRVDSTIYNTKESNIIIVKETSQSRVQSTTGTYTCAACITATTFSVLSQVVNGELIASTQVVFNGVAYGGGGSMTNCTFTGGVTNCTIQGLTEIPSGNIEWVGTVDYLTTTCNFYQGTWVKTNSGTNGTFITDPC
jgi:hypothetical protein